MKNNSWVFWLIGICSIVFMSMVLWLNYEHASKLVEAEKGLFGDMFGASNALFTGLSFTGVIIAILLQRQELKLQRNELELTRNGMELTRDEFSTQNSTMKLQQFENTFFQMLSLFHGNIDKISFSEKGVPYQGKELFKLLKKQIDTSTENLMKKRFHKNNDEKEYFWNHIDEEKSKITKNDIASIYLRACLN